MCELSKRWISKTLHWTCGWHVPGTGLYILQKAVVGIPTNPPTDRSMPREPRLNQCQRKPHYVSLLIAAWMREPALTLIASQLADRIHSREVTCFRRAHPSIHIHCHWGLSVFHGNLSTTATTTPSVSLIFLLMFFGSLGIRGNPRPGDVRHTFHGTFHNTRTRWGSGDFLRALKRHGDQGCVEIIILSD